MKTKPHHGIKKNIPNALLKKKVSKYCGTSPYIKSNHLRTVLIIEGTVCNIGEIEDRDKLKTNKYVYLRASLKSLDPGYSVQQINVVFDFLAGYNRNLIDKLNSIGLTDSLNVIKKCQKWIISQNCEIVMALYSTK